MSTYRLLLHDQFPQQAKDGLHDGGLRMPEVFAMTMGKEERVVEAALAWLEAERNGSAAQLNEAEDNLRERLAELKTHDAGREKPRYTKPVMRTLGLSERACIKNHGGGGCPRCRYGGTTPHCPACCTKGGAT